MSKRRQKLKKVIERLIEVEKQLSEIKTLYKERQDLIQKLLDTGRDTFETKKHVVILADSFENGSTAFKTVSFNRFEAVIQRKK